MDKVTKYNLFPIQGAEPIDSTFTRQNKLCMVPDIDFDFKEGMICKNQLWVSKDGKDFVLAGAAKIMDRIYTTEELVKRFKQKEA